MPDPITGLTIAGIIGVAAKQAQDFIAAVSGHPGDSIGTILGTLTKRRSENGETVGSRAHLLLLNIGVRASAIPLPVLVPTLEAASLEEDPSLQETWANLLANAADSRKITPVTATFPMILRELSIQDVRFLDAIAKDLNGEAVARSFIARGSLGINELQQLFSHANKSLGDGDSEADGFEYSLAILMRHNLISQFVSSKMVDRYDAVKNPNPKPEIALEEEYSLTSLAKHFIAACSKPQATPPNTA